MEIVASQFQSLVIDGEAQDRDVFVMIFAPWCGFSKRLQPRIDELARDLRHVSSLDIFKIDGTENDLMHPILHELTGYPFVALFPAGRKDAAVKIHVSVDAGDSAS